jgi:uracil-DNA glycosylase family 4
MVVPGEGDLYSPILFVGEGPGEKEDQQGRPFVGMAGQLLDRLIQETLGFRRDQVYITNVVKCRPPGNRDPSPDEMSACRSFLIAQIGLIAPRIICTLGRHSLHALLNPDLGISVVHGRIFHRDGILFFPTFHPAAALRSPEVKAELIHDFQHLHQLIQKEVTIGA